MHQGTALIRSDSSSGIASDFLCTPTRGTINVAATSQEAGASVKNRLHRLVDELPDSEAIAAERYLEYLAAIARGAVPQAVDESALLSEAALAEDWARPEEDAAWAHLQPARWR
jgi:hypothetical protein